MNATISIPRRLYEEARKRGVDVESMVVEVLARELELDPKEEATIHLELAERHFREALKLLDRGDAVPAAGKLYNAAGRLLRL